MAVDVRYERDVYAWLAGLELGQYYFMFKAAGIEKIKHVLYLEEADLARVGIEDSFHIMKLMVGIRHVCVPQKIVLNPKYSPVFQSARLVVDLFSFLDYTTLVRSTRVCKLWRQCLNNGVRRLTIDNPVTLGAPVQHVLCQFSALTDLSGFKFGPQGAKSMAQGLTALTKKTSAGSPLLRLNLLSSRCANAGVTDLATAMGLGAVTRLQVLNLSTNNMQQKGLTSLCRSLELRRHRGLVQLDLSYNAFGDRGMDALSDAIAKGATPALERLRLASVHMSDAGFAALCEPLCTRALPKLLVLDVRWNRRMRDRAAKRMMVVVSYDGTPSLQVLNMRGHNMSHRVIRQLHEACDGHFDLIV